MQPDSKKQHDGSQVPQTGDKIGIGYQSEQAGTDDDTRQNNPDDSRLIYAVGNQIAGQGDKHEQAHLKFNGS